MSTNPNPGQAPKRTVLIISIDELDLTDTQFFRVGQPDMRKLRSIDANNRKISIRIVADQLCGKFPTIGNGDHGFACTMHDVAISQNETIWRDNESRTASALFSFCARFNVHHRRRDPVDRADNVARVFVQQRDIALSPRR